MLNGDRYPKGDNFSAFARLAAGAVSERQQYDIRQRSIFPETAENLIGKDAQGYKVDYLSWDLGIIQLEQTVFSNSSKKARDCRAFLPGPECLVFGQHRHSDASTHSPKGPSSELECRIFVKSFNEDADEQILTLFVPRALFQQSASLPNTQCMRVLNSWQGALLANYLLSLARELPSISQQHWSELGAATCSVVQACLAPAPDSDAASESPTITALRERVRRIVRQQMTSPNFKPKTLGQLVAMSRSKLYRIFENSGGVARFIQQERLSEARRRLADIDVSDKIPISTLATEIGFRDHSSFSRAFKLRYGCSPSEYREITSANRPLEASEFSLKTDN
jgi:AraC-like DNA-binding protein